LVVGRRRPVGGANEEGEKTVDEDGVDRVEEDGVQVKAAEPSSEEAVVQGVACPGKGHPDRFADVGEHPGEAFQGIELHDLGVPEQIVVVVKVDEAVIEAAAERQDGCAEDQRGCGEEKRQSIRFHV